MASVVAGGAFGAGVGHEGGDRDRALARGGQASGAEGAATNGAGLGHAGLNGSGLGHAATSGSIGAGAATNGAGAAGTTAGGDARPIAGLDRAIGQRLISRVAGTTPSPALLARVRAGRVGGVLLFADNVRTLAQVKRLSRRLQAAAKRGGNPRLLIAVDQEGGTVRRLRSLPPGRAPRAMASPAVARAEGSRTGRALRSVGIDTDLAPVADVTADRSSFLYSRSFVTPERVCAFAGGLRAGGATPALKHFPGLGGAGANTDDRAVTLRPSVATLRARATPYRRCAGEHTLTMMANATYPALGPQPAVLEPRAYRFLRDLGARGPTISDDLQARALDGERRVEERALRAGLDLLLFGRSEAAAAQAHRRLKAAARAGRLDAADLSAAAGRIRAFKARAG